MMRRDSTLDPSTARSSHAGSELHLVLHAVARDR